MKTVKGEFPTRFINTQAPSKDPPAGLFNTRWTMTNTAELPAKPSDTQIPGFPTETGTLGMPSRKLCHVKASRICEFSPATGSSTQPLSHMKLCMGNTRRLFKSEHTP